MISREQFAPLMAYLCAAVQKQMPAETARVYFDLLADLPFEVLQSAIRASVVEHRYASLPPVAAIREIASRIQSGNCQITAMEALEGVRRLINRYGGEYATAEDRQAAFARMPATVAACLRSFGWDSFCRSENREALQAQWRMNWDAVSQRDQRLAALPETIRGAVAGRPVAIPKNLLRIAE